MWKKFNTIWTHLELRCTKTLGEFTKNSVHWFNLKLVQAKGLQFYQTRSHTIAVFNTLPPILIEKVVDMKTGGPWIALKYKKMFGRLEVFVHSNSRCVQIVLNFLHILTGVHLVQGFEKH